MVSLYLKLPGTKERLEDKRINSYRQALLQTIACLKSGSAAPERALAGATGEPLKIFRIVKTLAAYTGSPYAGGLQSLAEAFGAFLEVRKRRRVLLAGPKASIALISMLPFLAIALGYLTGFDPLAVLLHGYGRLLLVISAVLLALGMIWLQRMIDAVSKREKLSGYEAELLALAIIGGMNHGRAKLLVADLICDFCSEWLDTDALACDSAIGEALAVAAERGIGAVSVLREIAVTARRQQLEEIEIAAEKLGSKALLPLACCVLPAFIASGVVPLIVTMLQFT